MSSIVRKPAFTFLLLTMTVVALLMHLPPVHAMDKAVNPPAIVNAIEVSSPEQHQHQQQYQQQQPQLLAPEQNYIADIRVHSPEELSSILLRAELLLDGGQFSPGESAPVVFLLHGEEARVLFKSHYAQNKQLVDLTAKLSAFNVVDVRVCEAWMRKNKLTEAELQPFVDTVSYAPAAEKKLIEEQQYQYF